MHEPATITLPTAVYDAIIAHAREGKPEEICGVVRGRGLAAYETVRGRNIAAERIENYEVDPQTLLLQFEFEDAGDEMMGIYHSHPVSEAYPSATDAWNAHYPDCIYFICSLEDDTRPVIRAYRMTPRFLDVDVDALACTLQFHEVRPGLFGDYVDHARDLAGAPALLAELGGEVTPPYYVVYHAGEDRHAAAEVRVVSLTEHPLQIS